MSRIVLNTPVVKDSKNPVCQRFNSFQHLNVYEERPSTHWDLPVRKSIGLLAVINKTVVLGLIIK